MTRFVGESLSTRSGRKRNVLTGKERHKNMQEFMRTGRHPLIEQAAADNVSVAYVPLPTLDINRPHVFMDFSTRSGKQFGRVVIELFEDLFPAACAAFRNRCLEGHNTVKNSLVHKIQPNFAIYGGKLTGAAPDAPSTSGNKMQHIQAGLLSVHVDGTHFVLTLGRALPLDGDHKVIGRLGKGSDVLEALGAVPVDLDGVPETPVMIEQCGTTDHRGLNEVLSTAGRATTGDDAAASTRRGLADAGAGVIDALKDGLKRAPAPARKPPSKKLKGMLAELESDNSSDDEV